MCFPVGFKSQVLGVEMLKRLLLTGTALLLSSGVAAHADTIYDLNVQQNNKVGSSEGTVDVAQTAMDELTVTVTLGSGFYFVSTGSGDAIVFNFSDSNITVAPDTGFTNDTTTPLMASPWGNFDYGILCNPSAGSSCTSSAFETLVFTITDNGGDPISAADFTPNPGGNGPGMVPEVYFVADLQEGGGNVAAGAGSVPPVPEPSSLALLGTAALALAAFIRRRSFVS